MRICNSCEEHTFKFITLRKNQKLEFILFALNRMNRDEGDDMALKRKASTGPPSEDDKLTITPLGAGQEVGRSCITVEYKGKKIMVRVFLF